MHYWAGASKGVNIDPPLWHVQVLRVKQNQLMQVERELASRGA
jgi:hypothetical protein